jgi:hypothetical protein
MQEAGMPSVFRLGDPFPGRSSEEICEPHVSLFMLAVAEADLPGLLNVVARAAALLSPVEAVGTHYRHNPVGAPELFFQRTPAWFGMQTVLIGEAEPVRRGQLRETDPAGDHLAEVVVKLQADGSDPTRLAQLLQYGYDEVSDDNADRFNPHITFAWPCEPYEVDLTGLPDPADFSCRLEHVGVYGMQPNGTCTRPYDIVTLGGRVLPG